MIKKIMSIFLLALCLSQSTFAACIVQTNIELYYAETGYQANLSITSSIDEKCSRIYEDENLIIDASCKKISEDHSFDAGTEHMSDQKRELEYRITTNKKAGKGILLASPKIVALVGKKASFSLVAEDVLFELVSEKVCIECTVKE